MTHPNCSSVDTSANTNNSIIINTEIVLGNPQTSQCTGVGICRLFPESLRRSPHLKSVRGCFVFLPDGGVQLHLKRSLLDEQQYRKHFPHHKFSIQSGLQWPRWMQKHLPATAQTGIVPGAYVCRERDGEMVVYFG